MKSVFVILASQEYDNANHQGLWKEIAESSRSEVVVVNIPADYVVSILKGKQYRIKDAKARPRSVSDNLTVVRPLMVLRPELMPYFARKIVSNQIWASVRRIIPDIFECQVNLIVYSALWVKVLKDSHPNMQIGYYLFDEVRLDGEKVHKRQAADDDFACGNSDIIFTMTSVLAESRKSYNKRIIVVGNGSSYKGVVNTEFHINNSVAFIGIFRNWIDKSLLEGLIKSMPDCMFAFVGPVENDMQVYFDYLLNNFNNTIYFGKVSKDRMSKTYRLFDVVIVPYLQNAFTKATRPIKIVESVMSGTPVVTVPMDGYEQCDFIRFATSIKSFEKEIRYLINNTIDTSSENFRVFVNNNTWAKKAALIIDSFNK